MIIKFSSDVYENITMFGNVAEHLIKMMGYDVKARVIKAENISEALTKLKDGVANAPPEPIKDTDDQDDEPPVSLAHRALPLIEMLEASEKEHCDVTWKI